LLVASILGGDPSTLQESPNLPSQLDLGTCTEALTKVLGPPITSVQKEGANANANALSERIDPPPSVPVNAHAVNNSNNDFTDTANAETDYGDNNTADATTDDDTSVQKEGANANANALSKRIDPPPSVSVNAHAVDNSNNDIADTADAETDYGDNNTADAATDDDNANAASLEQQQAQKQQAQQQQIQQQQAHQQHEAQQQQSPHLASQCTAESTDDNGHQAASSQSTAAKTNNTATTTDEGQQQSLPHASQSENDNNTTTKVVPLSTTAPNLHHLASKSTNTDDLSCEEVLNQDLGMPFTSSDKNEQESFNSWITITDTEQRFISGIDLSEEAEQNIPALGAQQESIASKNVQENQASTFHSLRKTSPSYIQSSKNVPFQAEYTKLFSLCQILCKSTKNEEDNEIRVTNNTAFNHAMNTLKTICASGEISCYDTPTGVNVDKTIYPGEASGTTESVENSLCPLLQEARDEMNNNLMACHEELSSPSPPHHPYDDFLEKPPVPEHNVDKCKDPPGSGC